MTIDPVKIPQNVYVEDRIVGPITLRQILLTMISGAISYAIWAILQSAGQSNPVYTAIAWIPCLLGILFAFVKINGISLFRILLLSLERLEKPRLRVWTPHRGLYINIVTASSAPAHQNPDLEKKRRSREQAQLEELSEVLDQGPAEAGLHIGEAKVISKAAEEAEMELVSPLPAAPVNPARIQANSAPTSAPLDGIAQEKSMNPEPSATMQLLRDILPPPAHA